MHRGQGNLKHQNTLAGKGQPHKEGCGDTDGWKTQNEPATCTCRRQLYPGLHQKWGQQVEGGVSAPLFHSPKIPPGALCSAQAPAQGRRGPMIAGPEEGQENE